MEHRQPTLALFGAGVADEIDNEDDSNHSRYFASCFYAYLHASALQLVETTGCIPDQNVQSLLTKRLAVLAQRTDIATAHHFLHHRPSLQQASHMQCWDPDYLNVLSSWLRELGAHLPLLSLVENSLSIFYPAGGGSDDSLLADMLQFTVAFLAQGLSTRKTRINSVMEFTASLMSRAQALVRVLSPSEATTTGRGADVTVDQSDAALNDVLCLEYVLECVAVLMELLLLHSMPPRATSTVRTGADNAKASATTTTTTSVKTEETKVLLRVVEQSGLCDIFATVDTLRTLIAVRGTGLSTPKPKRVTGGGTSAVGGLEQLRRNRARFVSSWIALVNMCSLALERLQEAERLSAAMSTEAKETKAKSSKKSTKSTKKSKQKEAKMADSERDPAANKPTTTSGLGSPVFSDSADFEGFKDVLQKQCFRLTGKGKGV